jgi:hypothetical protein
MLAGILYNGQKLPWGEVLNHAKDGKIGHFPLPLISAIFRYSRQDHDLISASQLGGCLRQVYLRQVTDYYDSPSRWLPMMMGTFTHSLLEGCAQDQAELKVGWTTPDGVKVSGHIDHFDNGILTDYKTAKAIRIDLLPYGAHEIQTNIYKFLLEHNEDGPGHKVYQLRVVYISLSGAGERHDGVYTVPIRVWAEDKIRAFIVERAELLAKAEHTMPPKVKRKDSWLCNYCPPEVLEACARM